MDDSANNDETEFNDDTLVGRADAGVEPRLTPRTLALVCGGAVIVAVLGYGVWRGMHTEVKVPLAVPAANAAAAGQAVERAGVPVEWRDGHPWVAASNAARATEVATEALGQARAPRAAANAAAEESVFLSSEASRARRLGATMGAAEQMIESQAGVAHARVVLAEAGRPGAPGSAYSGPTAAATVTMTSGEMSQDLVDSVAALVSGCVPGLGAEHVAVIDANSNRQRTPRSAGVRQAADVRRERERELAERLRTALPDARDARVSVQLDDDGVPHAVVALSYAHSLLVIDAALPERADCALSAEEARVTALAQAVLASADGCAAPVVTVAMARVAEAAVPQSTALQPAATQIVAAQPVAAAPLVQVERTPALNAAGAAVAASVERERATPLGPGAGSKRSWDASTLALFALAGAAVLGGLIVASRRSARRLSMHAATAAGDTAAAGDMRLEPTHHAEPRDSIDDDTLDVSDGVDASDAVRADPTQAAEVLRGWLDTGYDTRVAHLVVALDSGAAGALLRAMPVELVNRVTVSLASLRTPSAHDLSDAADALAEEMAMLREPHAVEMSTGDVE